MKKWNCFIRKTLEHLGRRKIIVIIEADDIKQTEMKETLRNIYFKLYKFLGRSPV